MNQDMDREMDRQMGREMDREMEDESSDNDCPSSSGWQEDLPQLNNESSSRINDGRATPVLDSDIEAKYGRKSAAFRRRKIDWRSEMGINAYFYLFLKKHL